MNAIDIHSAEIREIDLVSFGENAGFFSTAVCKAADEIISATFLKIHLEMEWVDISDSYCSLKPLWSGMGGSSAGSYLADPPRRPYIPHPLLLCSYYPVWKRPSASAVVTSILRVKAQSDLAYKAIRELDL